MLVRFLEPQSRGGVSEHTRVDRLLRLECVCDNKTNHLVRLYGCGAGTGV
jgi:hypothetical protein